jgi:hypothetical protein
VEHEGDFRVDLVCIMDWKVKVLRKTSIEMVKVQWNYYSPKYVTWENEEIMREEYPQNFVNFEEKKMPDSILRS